MLSIYNNIIEITENFRGTTKEIKINVWRISVEKFMLGYWTETISRHSEFSDILKYFYAD